MKMPVGTLTSLPLSWIFAEGAIANEDEKRGRWEKCAVRCAVGCVRLMGGVVSVRRAVLSIQAGARESDSGRTQAEVSGEKLAAAEAPRPTSRVQVAAPQAAPLPLSCHG